MNKNQQNNIEKDIDNNIITNKSKDIDFDDIAYRIELELFEGPLDLLLYLIKRDEIDIYDIPIVHVAQQFMNYIDSARKLNLNIAGEYMLMASILLRIKVATLLPKNTSLSLDEIEDPREELVNMLLEYSRYRKMGEALARRYNREAHYYPRGHIDLVKNTQQLPLLQMDLAHLMKVAWEILKEEDKIIYQPLKEKRITVQMQIEYIVRKLRNVKQIQFHELFSQKISRMVFIVTFTAVLEMCRRDMVSLNQSESFSPLWIHSKKLEIDIEDDREENS